MLFSFRILTDRLGRDEKVLLSTERYQSFFIARNGCSEHVYTNIPSITQPVLKLNGKQEFSIELLAEGEVPFFSESQRKLNQDVTEDNGVFFRKTQTGEPDKLVCTFPHFKGHGGFSAPYCILDGPTISTDHTVFLAFQDRYFTSGSYMLCDNNGRPLCAEVVRVIKKYQSEFGIDASRTFFVGSSKGANIAAYIASFFDEGPLILCSYATDLRYFLNNTYYSYVSEYLEAFEVPLVDAFDLLFKQADRKPVHWFYSLNDAVCNRGNEQVSARMLCKYASNHDHSDVLAGSIEKIRQIIIGASA